LFATKECSHAQRAGLILSRAIITVVCACIWSSGNKLKLIHAENVYLLFASLLKWIVITQVGIVAVDGPILGSMVMRALEF